MDSLDRIDKVFQGITAIVGLVMITLLFMMPYFKMDKQSKIIEEQEKQIDDLEKEVNDLRGEVESWFDSYIDLGIKCGANE